MHRQASWHGLAPLKLASCEH